MKRALIYWLVIFAACMAQPAFAATQHTSTRCFNGYGYTLDSGDLRYIGHHVQHLFNGNPVKWTIVYYDPQGHVLATKHMNFTDNDTVPVYTFKIPSQGYVEGITHNDGWAMFRRNSANAPRKTKSFDISRPMAADSGFDRLVKKQFHKLMTGKTIKFKFAVAGHLSVLNMKAKKINTTQFEGNKAVVFRVELDSFFLNWFVKPLLLTYDPDTKRLLEYRGVGNMHNAQGDVYPVRVSYYSKPPSAAKDSGVPTGCTNNTSGQSSS